MLLPNDEDLWLELQELSDLLYECIGQEGVLGPSMRQYDKHRNRRWVSARPLLKVFGLEPVEGSWKLLLNAYGLELPTLQQTVQAHHNRKTEKPKQPAIPICPHPEDEFLTLRGSSVREEVRYVELDDGTQLKIVRTYISLR